MALLNHKVSERRNWHQEGSD